MQTHYMQTLATKQKYNLEMPVKYKVAHFNVLLHFNVYIKKFPKYKYLDRWNIPKVLALGNIYFQSTSTWKYFHSTSTLEMDTWIGLLLRDLSSSFKVLIK